MEKTCHSEKYEAVDMAGDEDKATSFELSCVEKDVTMIKTKQ